MPIDLKNLAVDTATCVVRFMGEESKVTYRPMAITAEAIEQGFDDSDATGDGFFNMFALIIADWDVKSGGKKVPLTTKALKGVPMIFLKVVYETVLKDSGDDVGEARRNSKGG